MKRRARNTYKILAVAVVATATGCAPSVAPAARTTPAVVDVTEKTAPTPVQAEKPVADKPVAEEPTIVPASVEEIPPPPQPPSPELYALANELQDVGEAAALGNMTHFRPLCDKDGYPLVGNIYRKSAGPHYQPSAFCATVRTKGTK